MIKIGQLRSASAGYGVALLLVAVTTAFRYSLTPIVGSLTPLIVYPLAAVLTALFAGRGPAIAAVALGSVVGYLVFLRHGGLESPALLAWITLDIVFSLVLIWIVDALRQSRNRARESEAKSSAAHRQLAELLEHIGDAFFSFDNNWRCINLNERAAAILNRTAADAYGKTFRELMPGVVTPEREPLLRRVPEERSVLALDGRAEPEGIWFELSAYPGADSISVFLRDITGRKQAEIAIAQSEERFRRIFKDSPVGMAIIDPDGCILQVNRAMCQMLEYTEEELTGLNVAQVTPHEDLQTSGFFSPMQQPLVRGATERIQIEKRYLTKSGGVIWTHLNASMLYESDGRRVFLGIVENVTERRQVEEQLREAQKLESLGVLAGGIAHDFNNLLTGILGNASLGLELVPPDSPVRPLLLRLVTAGERAADLTKQLLAYAGKGRFILTAINLSSTVEEIASLVHASFPRHVRLDLDLADKLPYVQADAAQIQQIIMNLLLNAAEAIPEDREGWVKIRTFALNATADDLRGVISGTQPPPGPYVVLEVTDNGCGMCNATQARIFEPFFTTKFTGRGLGLPAVLGIVGSYQGGIRVESHQGSGTTFRVLLPISEKVIVVPPEAQVRDLTGSGTVLVVDDEDVVRSLARNTLERFGYKVLTAHGGSEALEILRERGGEIKAILLDVTMPGMNGEETFQQLRMLRNDVPVILSSGHTEREAEERVAWNEAIAAPAGFLQKPYTASQLAAKIKSALQYTLH